MDQKRLWSAVVAMLMLAVAPAMAQQEEAPPAEEPDELVEEVIVVTASRTEQSLNEAPAAVSVLTAKDIESIPADNYGALLRNVPGLNVSQTSARDINMTSRGSTNTLSTSQLVLVDGRSLYLDFFGFVMWDFLPVNTAEIKQIEAVRGPGSAVWGANAMTGVVNLITKRPKEMVGTSLLFGGGELGTLYGSLAHAGVSDNFGYKVSAGYYEQDPYERPVIAGVQNFPNSGTAQPKGEVRLDWDLADDSVFSVGGGYAGTDGIIHTGIGPFDIKKGSDLTYGKLDWNKGAFRVGFFANFLQADSSNLVSVGTDGQPLGFKFNTDTYNLDASNTTVVGAHNIFTYGANYRDSKFDLEIAPDGTSKQEYGVFLQDEILLGDKLRWVIGGRYDDIDPIDGVFTPRTSLLFAPNTHHTFRVSYNEAFRTPSAINSYLDATILVGSAPLVLPANANGNVDLTEEHLTAYEVGYVGSFDNGITMTIAAYRNKTEDSIDFYTSRYYGPGNLPLGLIPPPLPAVTALCFLIPPTPRPLAPAVLQGCPPVALVGGVPIIGFGGLFPSNFSYRNIGETTDQGVELTFQQRLGTSWSWFANASWQDEPEFKGIEDSETSQNRPPEYRANLGLSYDNGAFFLNTNINYQDEAYWADVPLAVGSTDAFTQVNLAVGFRLLDERMTLQVIGSNIFDEDIQQHYYGDILSRKITGQIGFRF
jgi:outer membrane receptor protein involved in Fe transport